jgi:hypothetical protein
MDEVIERSLRGSVRFSIVFCPCRSFKRVLSNPEILDPSNPLIKDRAAENLFKI